MTTEADEVAAEGGSADARARTVEQQMTDDERFSLLVSVMGVNDVVTSRDPRIPDGVPMSAGYVPGVGRLGVPAQLMSDVSLGVTNPGYRKGDSATALPAGIALGASFNPALARMSGEMIGREARSRGPSSPSLAYWPVTTGPPDSGTSWPGPTGWTLPGPPTRRF